MSDRVVGGHYRVERRLAGGMGVLLVVRDMETGARLAVKTLREDSCTAELARRFRREARAWIALGEHPHVVRALRYEESDGLPLLFMEYIDGPDLERLLLRTGALPLRQALEFAQQLLSGLSHAHRTLVGEGAKGLVHRDLKPSNLLVARNRVLMITDWGLVKVLGGTRQTEAGQILGTLSYCSPEQIMSASEVDARSDLFACGAVLYEMIAGRKAFPGEDAGGVVGAILGFHPPALADVVAGCPQELSDLVDRLLAKDRSGRPEDARTALEALGSMRIPDEAARSCPTCGLMARVVVDACPLCAPDPEPGEAQPERLLPARPRASPHDLRDVPEGPFLFGPERQHASTGAYRIARTPVTNAQFLEFLEATLYRPGDAREFLRHWNQGRPPAGREDHPVVWVSWHDAAAYADWAALELPTWEEWDKAARGTDGRWFPWGDRFDPSRCNSREGGVGSTTGALRFAGGASPFGCLDMLGNVFEWTATWREPDQRRTKILCGASWAVEAAREGLDLVRNVFPHLRDYQTGFRCIERGGA